MWRQSDEDGVCLVPPNYLLSETSSSQSIIDARPNFIQQFLKLVVSEDLLFMTNPKT